MLIIISCTVHRQIYRNRGANICTLAVALMFVDYSDVSVKGKSLKALLFQLNQWSEGINFTLFRKGKTTQHANDAFVSKKLWCQ